MHEDRITVCGVVGSDPRTYITGKGEHIVSFRLASSPRVFDRTDGTWRDGATNWYTVSAFRRLADNVEFSLRKGERVVVTGKFKLRSWETAEKRGSSAEIEAEAIGHDMNWAVTRPHRMQTNSTANSGGQAAVEGGQAEAGGLGVIDAVGVVDSATGEIAELEAAVDAPSGEPNTSDDEYTADDEYTDQPEDELAETGEATRSGLLAFGARR